MNGLLEFDHITYAYQDGKNQKLILDDASYIFETGKIYAIEGPSGSGKTTTLILAGGLDQPQQGKVIFAGEPLKKSELNRYRQKNVAIVFQSYNLIYYMNAIDNVINAMNIAHIKVNNKKQYCLELLKKLGLQEDECFRDIRKLSGGQQQRVALARAMGKSSQLILANEPTGNLDEKTSLEIMRYFIKLAHDENKCVIIVIHSRQLADLCDVKIHIQEGKLITV